MNDTQKLIDAMTFHANVEVNQHCGNWEIFALALLMSCWAKSTQIIDALELFLRPSTFNQFAPALDVKVALTNCFDHLKVEIFAHRAIPLVLTKRKRACIK
jgi:hypothetical protein